MLFSHRSLKQHSHAILSVTIHVITLGSSSKYGKNIWVGLTLGLSRPPIQEIKYLNEQM